MYSLVIYIDISLSCKFSFRARYGTHSLIHVMENIQVYPNLIQSSQLRSVAITMLSSAAVNGFLETNTHSVAFQEELWADGTEFDSNMKVFQYFWAGVFLK